MSNEYDPNYIPTYARFLLGTKVILFDEDGKILFLKRSDKTSRPHGWDFPGGGVDAGEDLSEAAIREVVEETGLSIEHPTIVGTITRDSSNGDYVIVGYKSAYSGGEVVLSWEHEAYEWIPLATALELELPSLHRGFLETYARSL